MDASTAAIDPVVMSQAWRLLEMTALAMLAGWAAERLFETGLRIRGLPLFCGLAGLYLGSWLWSVGGWESGPLVAGLGIVPLFAGTLAVAALFKLATLGAAGPRW